MVEILALGLLSVSLKEKLFLSKLLYRILCPGFPGLKESPKEAAVCLTSWIKE